MSAGAVAASCTAGGGGDGSVARDREALTTTGAGGGFGVGGANVSVQTATSGFSVSTATGAGGGFGVGVGAGGGFGTGGGGSFGPMPVAFWKFDDCTSAYTTLADSSGFGNTATRTSSVTCVPGIEGLAVDFSSSKNDVTAVDVPAFAFSNQFTVAAWIKPTTVSGTQTIVTQQAKGKTTFALSVNNKSVEFAVTLENGQVVTSTAPITAGTWSHVAGQYDGHFVFLYLDGQQVGQVDVPGTIKDAAGPISIGNNSSNQHFDGAIDNVWISTDPVQVSDIAALACIRQPPTFTVSPASGPPSPPDSTVDYSVVVTNNSAGFCPAQQFFVFPQAPQGFTAQVTNQFSQPVPPGGTATFPIAVTASETPAPGTYPIPFFVQDFQGDFLQGQLTYNLVAPSGCFAYITRELMITDLSVVEDPIRTTWKGDPTDPRTGAWTFATLMQNLAPSPGQASALVQQLVNTWLTDQQVGGFTVPARPEIQQLVINPWPKLADGSLDLTKAPLRLNAIVNRMDVRNLDQGKAGEGRFVFSVLDPNGFPLQFTLIVEYNLPATTDADVQNWANAWHSLSSNPFPSEQYNAALQALTTKFVGRNANPSGINGSALAQLRTNEIALSFEWQLREFHLSPTTGLLQEAGVALTPDLSLDRTQPVADFINQNQAAVLTQIFDVPPTFEGQPFQGGASLNPITFWTGPGIVDNDARQLFSLNTCNGCHGAETGTAFLQIAPRFPGQQSQLSGFLTGITVSDPVSGVPRHFADLSARQADLTSLVCAPPNQTAAVRAAFMQHGRRKVH